MSTPNFCCWAYSRRICRVICPMAVRTLFACSLMALPKTVSASSVLNSVIYMGMPLNCGKESMISLDSCISAIRTSGAFIL